MGEDVALSGVTRVDEWRQICATARRCPAAWAAQRRFEAVPLDSPRGKVYPQFGIFTLDSRAAGIYGRLAPRPLIDCRSQDVAVLVANDAISLHPPTAGARL